MPPRTRVSISVDIIVFVSALYNKDIYGNGEAQNERSGARGTRDRVRFGADSPVIKDSAFELLPLPLPKYRSSEAVEWSPWLTMPADCERDTFEAHLCEFGPSVFVFALLLIFSSYVALRRI